MQEKKKSEWNGKAKYKLVVYFSAGQGRNYTNKPKVFFSRERLDKLGDEGRIALQILATTKWKGKYTTAILYDNQTGNELNKWVLNRNNQLEQRL